MLLIHPMSKTYSLHWETPAKVSCLTTDGPCLKNTFAVLDGRASIESIYKEQVLNVWVTTGTIYRFKAMLCTSVMIKLKKCCHIIGWTPRDVEANALLGAVKDGFLWISAAAVWSLHVLTLFSWKFCDFPYHCFKSVLKSKWVLGCKERLGSCWKKSGCGHSFNYIV